MASTPRLTAQRMIDQTRLPDGVGDRAHGYGVMGVPFESGDYLAFRHWPATSFGPGYRAIWHKDPRGAWTIYADEPPAVSCARFTSAAADRIVTAPIGLTWTGQRRLTVEVCDIRWHFEICDSPSTTGLTLGGSVLPEAGWRSTVVLNVMGHVAGPVLRAGRLRLVGHTPNRQRYRMAARRTWLIGETGGLVGTRLLGSQSRPAQQVRIGPMLLPQRGIFFADGTARFTGPEPGPDPVPGGTQRATTTTGGAR